MKKKRKDWTDENYGGKSRRMEGAGWRGYTPSQEVHPFATPSRRRRDLSSLPHNSLPPLSFFTAIIGLRVVFMFSRLQLIQSSCVYNPWSNCEFSVCKIYVTWCGDVGIWETDRDFRGCWSGILENELRQSSVGIDRRSCRAGFSARRNQ